MVSNSLNMELRELLDILEGAKGDSAEDPEYLTLREQLPSEWPL